MRAYNLVISDPVTGLVWQPSISSLGLVKAAGGSTFTSFANGTTTPGALNIEFDFPVYPFATPQGNGYIRVWGIGLPMIAQGAQLAGQNFMLYAGMQKGLPLANPAQYGLVAQGTIFQAFGNWQGTKQTLDLVLYPASTATINWNWPGGTALGPSLQAALYQAFPNYTVPTPNISPNLMQPQTDTGVYSSLAQFAGYLQGVTKPLGAALYGANYSGVQLALNGLTINCYDGQGPTPVTPTQIAFQDLIGQPTWIGVNTVDFSTPIRTDLTVGDLITFSPGINAPFALTAQAAAMPNAPAASRTAFQGTFQIIEVHHFANFRQPDAESWNTTFSAVGIVNPTTTPVYTAANG